MFSCPLSINKNKEVTSFCDKSRHLFLWQTNRTSLELLLQLSASASLTISSEFSGLMYELELIEITSMESTIQFLKHIFLLYTWIISILNLSWFLNSWILISNGFETWLGFWVLTCYWADDKQMLWIIPLWWLSVSLWRICVTFLWPSKIFCINKTVPGTKPPGG